MSGTCCVCLKQSINKLTPLFNQNEKLMCWEPTKLMRMIEKTGNKIKIQETEKALLVICESCIFQILDDYPKNHDEQLYTSQNPTKKLKTDVDNDITTNNSFELNIRNEKRITILNNDCLSYIFRHLSVFDILKMQKVCKKFKDAVQTVKYDIKEINFDDYKGSFNHQIEVEKILRYCGSSLVNLKINKVCNSTILQTITKHCSNVVKLQLYLNEIDEYDFVDVFTNMENLKSFDLRGETFDHDLNYMIIFDNLPVGLTEIIMSSFVKIPAQKFHNFIAPLEKFTVLSRLTLSDCLLQERTIVEIANIESLVYLEFIRCKAEKENVNIKQSNLRNLKYFKMLNSPEMTDGSLVRIVTGCRNLTHFELKDCYENSYELVLVQLSTLYRKLEHIHFEDVSDIDKDVIECLVINCAETMKYLAFINCNDTPVDVFMKIPLFYNLEKLIIFYPDELKSSTIESIAYKCKKLKYLDICLDASTPSLAFRKLGYLKNLEHLDLSGAQVDDVCINRLINNCDKLKHLYLQSCKKLSSSTLKNLSNLINLEELFLPSLLKVNNNVIVEISKKCKKLKKIDLSQCISLSKTGLSALGNLCNLEVVYLINLKSVNDTTLSIIAKKCRQLKELCIDYCEVTDFSLKKIIKKCTNLEVLKACQTKMSVKTLEFAVNETKRRPNYITLNIVTNFYLKMPFVKLHKKSSLLAVHFK